MLGLHSSQSDGPVGFQSNVFAMPGLTNLHNLREQTAAEHSLFSGQSNTPGFSQNQFRQRSRFQFAQDSPAADSVFAEGPNSPSLFSSVMSPAAQQQAAGQHEHSYAQPQPQQRHQTHHFDHQLFPSGPGLAPASLFAGSSGMTSINSAPHHLDMHTAESQPDVFARPAASLLCQTGQH